MGKVVYDSVTICYQELMFQCQEFIPRMLDDTGLCDPEHMTKIFSESVSKSIKWYAQHIVH